MSNGIAHVVAGDGYGIVLESLEHYIRRLKNMGDDPAVGAGMFGSVIMQAAMSRYLTARSALQSVANFMIGGAVPTADDIMIIKSSLECYESDLQQAMAGSEYHSKLLRSAPSESKILAVRKAKMEMFGTS